MDTKLDFKDFETTSPKVWKQKIQFDLKGEDYNKTLLWKTDEGITVKPFYTKEDRTNYRIPSKKKSFAVCQSIFIDDEKISNKLATDALLRGANAIEFIAKSKFDYTQVLENIDLQTTLIYFRFQFLDVEFISEINKHFTSKNLYFDIDIIGSLAKTGNWFSSLTKDINLFKEFSRKIENSVCIRADLYQNAGANMAQQLAYTLAHANEYLNLSEEDISQEFHFKFAVGSNYFFEIAKLKAFQILWKSLLETHGFSNNDTHIFTTPSLRNKTIYDYNVNMLRTTSECMSAVLGGSNTVSNVSYDTIYHKSNEFGERIARNQLLILKEESYFSTTKDFAEGSYYIENITQQLAEKALVIFKQIEKGGGFLKQLKQGIIQNKIKESADAEQQKFDAKEIVLLGTNIYQKEKDFMKDNLELYPFLKQKNSKTLIIPILTKRLSENIEKARIKSENSHD